MRKLISAAMAFAVTATLILAPQSAEAERVWPIYGRPGDAGVTVACPEGEALVGFDGRVGGTGTTDTAIHQVQIMCARLLSDRTFGAPHPEGDPVGGAGGDPRDPVTCPQNARMHDLTIWLNKEGKQIDALTFDCMDAAGNVSMRAFNSRDGNWGTGTNRPQSCPQEYFTAVGIRFGRHVNGVGAICEPLTLPAAAAPKPIKSSGKARPSGPVMAPIAALRGGWNTKTSSDGYFTVILIPQHDGVGMLAGQPIPVTGQFINQQGAHDYDGSLQGTIPPNSRTLIYSYTQNNGASGTGTFTLSNDGNSITGSGTTSDGASFTWNGTRSK